jgi:hypothetical protein
MFMLRSCTIHCIYSNIMKVTDILKRKILVHKLKICFLPHKRKLVSITNTNHLIILKVQISVSVDNL